MRELVTLLHTRTPDEDIRAVDIASLSSFSAGVQLRRRRTIDLKTGPFADESGHSIHAIRVEE
jgi:hypothetical protein